MSYGELSIPSFAGGLDLRSQPDVLEPGFACDLENVTFTDRGAIKRRDGYTDFASYAADSIAPFYKTDGTKQLLTTAGTVLRALSSTGTEVTTTTLTGDEPATYVRFGSPNSELAYIANGTEGLNKWDGSAFSQPTVTVDEVAAQASPWPSVVCLWPRSNRLVCTSFTETAAGPGGATSSPSHVYFSEQGLPESFNTDEYSQLTPGDGEKVMGACAWRELVFVFKETRFFVYRGESIGVDGTATFDYDPIEANAGLASKRGLAVGRDGVYFVDRKGLYRTTGGVPARVSDLIEPVFSETPPSFWNRGVIDHERMDETALTYHNEQLYLSLPLSGGNSGIFVFDPDYGWWSFYRFVSGGFTAATSFKRDDHDVLVFGDGTQTFVHSAGASSDDGTAISFDWRSGWMNAGSPNSKVLREWKCWARGRANIGTAVDFQTTASTTDKNFYTGVDMWGDGSGLETWGDGGVGDTWGGGGPILRPKTVRGVGKRGTYFQLVLSDVGGRYFELHAATAHLLGQEIQSKQKEATVT